MQGWHAAAARFVLVSALGAGKQHVGVVRPGKALGRHSAAPEAVGKVQGCAGCQQGAGRESHVAQPLQHREKEVGATLPAPLKPEHGGRENRGEKRQQLGAEPASSWGERLEKDRVCIVP